MYFFHQKDARIVWNEKDNIIYEFMVVQIGENKPESLPMRNCRSSLGNCSTFWKDLNEFDLTLCILQLFLDTDFSDSKFKRKCLLQCGQILELKEFRKMLRRIYHCDMLDEEFDEKYYGN